MTEIIVIGAGVIGASVAYRLAQADVSVTILEAGRVGGGASTVSFALTSARRKRPRAYHGLNVDGMRAHVALRREFGSIPWYHEGGTVEWLLEETDRVDHRKAVEELRSWGYTVEWITPVQLKELEPDIDLATVGEASVAYYPEEGWIDPAPYAHAMVQAARRAGAILLCGVGVDRIETKSGRVTGVRTTDGQAFSADVVVNCAGRWADEVARMADLRVPLRPSVGLLVFTPPVATSLSRAVLAPSFHMRPDGAGRLVLGADDTDRLVTAETEPSHTLASAQDLVRRAACVLPSISGATPEAVRIAVRPIPADGYPAVGPIPGVAGYYQVVTHSGVNLAPLLGHAVANEIVYGRIEPRLEPFRPSRFRRS